MHHVQYDRPPKYEFAKLRDTEKGACLVLGLGESVRHVDADFLDTFPVLGVNDIAKVRLPDWLVLVDGPDTFARTNGRLETILGTIANPFTTTCAIKKHRWAEYPGAGRMLSLGTDMSWSIETKRAVAQPMDYTRFFKGLCLPDGPMLPMFWGSTHLAIHLAAFLGFRKIGVLGHDLSDQRFISEHGEWQSKMRYHVEELRQVAGNTVRDLREHLDCQLVNLSSISKVDTIPYMSPEDFVKWASS